jgi:hypothetical protein
MDGLRNVVGGLNQLGFRLEVWVNGSFLTQKINPEDSDVAVRFQGEDFDAAPPAQQRQFHQYVNMDFKAVHKCDLMPFRNIMLATRFMIMGSGGKLTG